MLRSLGIFMAIMLGVTLLAGMPACSMYNTLNRRDEAVRTAQARLDSVGQKRADLFGNLVETVKGSANHESGTLTKWAEARAGAANAKLPENPTPEQIAAFDKAQSDLRTAIAGAMRFTVEAAPQLKANQNFLALQKQIQDTETQMTAARGVYIRAVESYNLTVRGMPHSIMASMRDMKVKPQLQFENADALKKAPQVKF
jgi:LemA protein